MIVKPSTLFLIFLTLPTFMPFSGANRGVEDKDGPRKADTYGKRPTKEVLEMNTQVVTIVLAGPGWY
jgi:hypothetical protein